jgi:phosphotransferase system HPr (HPr) family protein
VEPRHPSVKKMHDFPDVALDNKVDQDDAVVQAVGMPQKFSPAALFVQKASSFGCDIRIHNQTTGSNWINAKSILGVLTLGVEKNHAIEIEADGEDEQAAINCLIELVRSNFVVKPIDT